MLIYSQKREAVKTTILKKLRDTLLTLLGVLLLTGCLAWAYDDGTAANAITLKPQRAVYPLGAELIRCTLNNGTPETIDYGIGFVLEQFVDGQWFSVNDREFKVMFAAVEFTAPPFSSAEIAFPAHAFSILKDAADFRIVFEVRMGPYWPSLHKEALTLYCPFSVR